MCICKSILFLTTVPTIWTELRHAHRAATLHPRAIPGGGMVGVSVRAVGPRSSRDDADRSDHELRVLRARWRTASLANGWRFPSDWPVPEVDAVCASLVDRADVCE